MHRIELFLGDITRLKVDAIVNSANPSLLGGGGVDGAIHKAAGDRLAFDCRILGRCNPGEAKITSGYNLQAKYVIHTVGPVWQGGDKNEASLLSSCYKKCFEIAASKGFTTIAFPNISTGVYGYPKKEAAKIAIAETELFLKNNPSIEKVIFAIFEEENYQIYKNLIKL